MLGVSGEKATAYEPSMRLMAANLSRYPLDKIVTHRFGLARAADALVVARSDDAMQVVIDPADAQPDDDEARGESSRARGSALAWWAPGPSRR